MYNKILLSMVNKKFYFGKLNDRTELVTNVTQHLNN